MTYATLNELYAATAKERDEARREIANLREIVDRQARLNCSLSAVALKLDRAVERLGEWEKFRKDLLFAGKIPPEKWEGK